MEWKKFFLQMKRAAKLDRTLYTQLLFDDYATANAVMVVGFVAAVGAAIQFFGRRVLAASLGFPASEVPLSYLPILIFGVALSALIGWIISAGGFWLAGVKLFDGRARFQSVLRLVGFGYITLALVELGELLSPRIPGFNPSNFNWIIFASLIWYGFSLHIVAKELFELRPQEYKITAFLGVAAWLSARFIF